MASAPLTTVRRLVLNAVQDRGVQGGLDDFITLPPLTLFLPSLPHSLCVRVCVCVAA